MFTELNGCANCKRQNPKKRCAKRHTKCMNKLFCDGVCEKAAHTKSSAAPPPENNENSDQALNVAANAKLEKAKAAEKKKKADKKAKKKPNQGTTRCSGEFWWA